MIFVITGIHEHGFNRLVKAVDDLAKKDSISDVCIQTGFSDYEPKYCKWYQAVDYDEFESQMDNADIIISHGGAGCIAGALERNKTTIVVPRYKIFDEHNNDHQLELASDLEKAGRVLVVRDIKLLKDTIERAKNFKPKPNCCDNSIAQIISDYLEQLEK